MAWFCLKKNQHSLTKRPFRFVICPGASGRKIAGDSKSCSSNFPKNQPFFFVIPFFSMFCWFQKPWVFPGFSMFFSSKTPRVFPGFFHVFGCFFPEERTSTSVAPRPPWRSWRQAGWGEGGRTSAEGIPENH